MVDWKYLLLALWSWIVAHGLTLAALIVVGILIPRVGRLIVRIVTERMSHSEEQTKSYLALVGALVYLLEIVAYFFLIYTALTELGVSTMSAAVPATVVSAAIGFGAQKVIADFLAGFFIISEHQYGVGDVVAFDGTSDKVTGTVVRVTLRATQIRTGNGELITLPNSQASVTINSSQEWSRAVVDLELPMTGNDTMSSLAETVSLVTQRAIDDGEVRDEILGEVSVLPAMSITAPTAAGLPWTVGIQVTVDVNPATQWKVQRIIRAALINEFWDRFQAPGDRPKVAYPGPPTEAFPPVRESDIAAAAATASAADAVEAGEPRPSDATPPGEGTVDREDTDTGESGDSASSDGDTDDATPRPAETRPSGSSFDAVAADVAENGIWRNLDTNSKITRVLSLNGRIRPSSGILVIVIILIAVVGLLSANPDGGRSGFLSPDRWAPATEEPTTVEQTTPAPETSEETPDSVTPTPYPSDSQQSEPSEGATGSGNGTDGSGGSVSDSDGTGTANPTAENGVDEDQSNQNGAGTATEPQVSPRSFQTDTGDGTATGGAASGVTAD